MIDWCLTSGREQVNRWHCHRCLDWSLDCHQNTIRWWIWPEYFAPTTPSIFIIHDMLHVVLCVHGVKHSSRGTRLRHVLRVIWVFESYIITSDRRYAPRLAHGVSDHQIYKVTINVCEFKTWNHFAATFTNVLVHFHANTQHLLYFWC